MIANAYLDFGYPWWLSYGHLPLVAGSGLLLALGFWRKWPIWTIFLLSPILLWSSTAFLAARFVLNVNGEAALPTQSFLRSGVGRVLDIGAGTGRSSIMVLKARPQATLVALDLFGESFNQHFGRSRSPQQRLLANLEAAGVAHRVAIVTADMRKLPFDRAAFDAIVSAYVFEHLNREGIQQSLAEAARVVKPGGGFPADACRQRTLVAIHVWTDADAPELSRCRLVDAASSGSGFSSSRRGNAPGDSLPSRAKTIVTATDENTRSPWDETENMRTPRIAGSARPIEARSGRRLGRRGKRSRRSPASVPNCCREAGICRIRSR